MHHVFFLEVYRQQLAQFEQDGRHRRLLRERPEPTPRRSRELGRKQQPVVARGAC